MYAVGRVLLCGFVTVYACFCIVYVNNNCIVKLDLNIISAIYVVYYKINGCNSVGDSCIYAYAYTNVCVGHLLLYSLRA